MNIFDSNFSLIPFQQFKMDLQFLSVISFVWGLAVENARISDQSIPVNLCQVNKNILRAKSLINLKKYYLLANYNIMKYDDASIIINIQK